MWTKQMRRCLIHFVESDTPSCFFLLARSLYCYHPALSFSLTLSSSLILIIITTINIVIFQGVMMKFMAFANVSSFYLSFLMSVWINFCGKCAVTSNRIY